MEAHLKWFFDGDLVNTLDAVFQLFLISVLYVTCDFQDFYFPNLVPRVSHLPAPWSEGTRLLLPRLLCICSTLMHEEILLHEPKYVHFNKTVWNSGPRVTSQIRLCEIYEYQYMKYIALFSFVLIMKPRRVFEVSSGLLPSCLILRCRNQHN